MRAVAVPRFRAPPELLDASVPEVESGQVRVRVEFAGINPLDWKIGEGIYEGKRPHVFPLILGIDATGVVEDVDASVRRFRVGDRIFGQFLHDPVGSGTYAEFTTVPESIGVTQVPAVLGSAEAAALPTSGMTALDSLDTLALPAGSRLLITGASGGVGSLATELAHAQGLHVIAAARPNSWERLRRLGASEFVDPSDDAAIGRLAREDGPAVDGLLDLMSDRAGFARWTSVVRRGGAAVTTTFSSDPAVLADRGLKGGNINLQPNAALLERLARWVQEHRLSIPLERTVRLAEAAEALAEVRAGRATGKTVINVRT